MCSVSVVQIAGEPGGEKKERAANLINIGNGAVQVYLSSAAKEDPKSDDTILIGPPFYLELKLGGFSLPVQVNQTHNVASRSYLRQIAQCCVVLHSHCEIITKERSPASQQG